MASASNSLTPFHALCLLALFLHCSLTNGSSQNRPTSDPLPNATSKPPRQPAHLHTDSASDRAS